MDVFEDSSEYESELVRAVAGAFVDLADRLPEGSRIVESLELSVLPRVLTEAGLSGADVGRIHREPFRGGAPDRNRAVARAVELLAGGPLDVDSDPGPIGVAFTQVDDGSRAVLVVSGLSGETVSVADFAVRPGSDVVDLAIECLIHLSAWGLPVDTDVVAELRSGAE